MNHIAHLLRTHVVLRFLSSVYLAIPLLLALAIAAAVGTIIESRYNSEYARLLLYDHPWFFALLAALSLNILLATWSRYPFRLHHLGFVIVHVGLLLLMAGAFVTWQWGIDGQLRVEESQSSRSVLLTDLVVELIDVKADLSLQVPMKPSPFARHRSSLRGISQALHDKIQVLEYMPFAKLEESYGSDPQSSLLAMGFMLKNPFATMSEWLDSGEHRELRVGPALVRLVVDRPAVVTQPKKDGGFLLIRDTDNRLLGRVAVSALRPGLDVGAGIKITQVRRFRNAVVGDKKLVEANRPGSNPALELMLKHGQEELREVVFAHFPDFSLTGHGGRSSSLRFTYEIDNESAQTLDRAGNVIEFHVNSADPQKVQVVLYKDNQRVLSEKAEPGETVVTPWMGMSVVIGAVQTHALRKSVVSEAEVVPRGMLPPSAMQFAVGGERFWLLEGQSERRVIEGREYEIYFGRHVLSLPFQVKLKKFEKIDYPGSDTALEFASHILIDDHPDEVVVSMNEPLKRQGFTLYQSSYDLRPGHPPASIFSVNRDPGRWTKYLGSLITASGIIIFTLMRSRFYQRRQKPTEK